MKNGSRKRGRPRRQTVEQANGRASRPLHRIRDVREQQGFSPRRVARWMMKTVSQVKHEEDEFSDLSLTDLHRWQKALGVPLADLLIEPMEGLSDPIQKRARLVRIMKTASAIADHSDDPQAQVLGQRLVSELVALMPELKDVKPWERVGKRRSGEDVGRIAERPLSEEWLNRGDHVPPD